MCCQTEEFIAAVRAEAVDEQCKINSHDCFAQQHVEPRLVLLSCRRQQRNQGRHTCRERTHTNKTWHLCNLQKRLKQNKTLSLHNTKHIYETFAWWRDQCLPFRFLPRGHEAPIIEHHLPLCINTDGLLCSSSPSAFHILSQSCLWCSHICHFAFLCILWGFWNMIWLSFYLIKTIYFIVLPQKCEYRASHWWKGIAESGEAGALLPGHCAGAELGVMCSSMLSVRSRLRSLSNRPWYTIPVNWLASAWLLQSQQQKSKLLVQPCENVGK